MPIPWPIKLAIEMAHCLVDFSIKKGRNVVANRLVGGDVLNEEIRTGLITELHEITSKLDAFSCRELETSISYIQDGFIALEMPINVRHPESEDRNVERPSEVHEGVILALRSSIAELGVLSEKHVADAKECFKTSLGHATMAFNNKGLTMQDRIIACRLRIISKVFHNFEDLDSAAKYCLKYLKDLHNIQQIKSIFAVQDRGGIRAWFRSGKRCDIVNSVNMINYVLYNFISECTSHKLGIFDWPMIYLGAQRCYHPICECENVLESTNAKVPWEMAFVYSQTVNRNSYTIAINSLGEILEVVNGQNIKLTRLTGTRDTFCVLPIDESVTWYICSLAVDKHDDTYVTCQSWDRQSDIYLYKLFIFNTNGELKHQAPLDFLGGEKKSIRIAVNYDKKVVIREACQNRLFICDSNDGTVDCTFCMPSMMFVLWSISRKNELILANKEMDSICIYTVEGTPKLTIKLPKDHLVRSAAFHGPTGDIFVYTCKAEEDPTSFYLLRFSENGQLLQSHSARTWWNNDFYYLLSHPKGVVALFSHRKAIFILLNSKFLF